MLNPILAHTSSGVETVSQLDKDALDKLAKWLCRENAYHDDKHPHGLSADAWDRSCEVFEKQQQRNGGYCNTCRDFAGELLANFDLTEGKEARIKRMDREFGKF